MAVLLLQEAAFLEAADFFALRAITWLCRRRVIIDTIFRVGARGPLNNFIDPLFAKFGQRNDKFISLGVANPENREAHHALVILAHRFKTSQVAQTAPKVNAVRIEQ